MKQFQSISDKIEGKITASCGHEVDARKIVFVHFPDHTETACEKCSKHLKDWKGRA